MFGSRVSWLLIPVMGCSFSTGAQNVPRDGEVIIADTAPDAYIPDSGLCPPSEPPECVGGEVLRSCPTPGSPPTDLTCYWGCQPTAPGPHCGRLTPSGGVAGEGDLDRNDALATVTIPASGATFNTDTGAITTAAGLVNGVNYQQRAGKAMFQFTNLFLNGPITIVGNRAVALVATDRITINAAVSVQGPCTGSTAGPGGHLGGAGNGAGVGTGGGAAGGNDALDSGGGGGGGYGGMGGTGGGSIDAGVDAPPDAPPDAPDVGAGVIAAAPTQALGGTPYGTPTIAALDGGGGGGGGGGANAGRGGGGGGAIQFVANIRIEITANGSINASGCGGAGATSLLAGGGGGGGAGGTIVLEAAVISLVGSSLAVNGGGGGGGPNQPGARGTLGRTGALGGGVGGVGGAGATANGGAGATAYIAAGGGGGGSVGRMRFNVAPNRTVTLMGPVLSPALDDPSSTTTQGTANVK